MVYPLAESASTIAAMERQMAGSYRMRTRVRLLDYQFGLVQELTGAVLGGSVQVDADSEESTRSLSLELEDPSDMLGLSTGERIRTPNRMVLVYRGIFVDEVDRWIDVPVFAGPITSPSRSDGVLSVEAKDKVAFAAEPRATYTVKRGTNKATAIRQLMQATCGENRFRIATTSERMQDDHTVDMKERSPWELVRLICKSLGWVCFYDGGGYLVCKPRSTAPVVEFRSGPGGLLVSEAQAGYWENDIRNRVTVLGGTISRTVVSATVTVEADHPLSPENLRTGSQRWFKTEYVEDTNIMDYDRALSLARRTLLEISIQQSSATFDAVPFWHLQEHDPFAVETADGMFVTRLAQTTIPLTSEGAQSFGYNTPTGLATRRPMRVARKNPYIAKAIAKVAAQKRAEEKKRREQARKKAAREQKRRKAALKAKKRKQRKK